ncbi:hypothetical protein ACR71G_01630 [Xenorhabdus bovienii]|uniref:hypothetical protein n=1 Tax=Xenorhabdus bovienii TaxID=40576 RepID=UPI003DA38C6D
MRAERGYVLTIPPYIGFCHINKESMSEDKVINFTQIIDRKMLPVKGSVVLSGVWVSCRFFVE